MKIQMKLHLLYIVAIVLLASCENEIPYNPDNQQPLLIMNAQLDAGKDVNEVFLHLSKGSSIVRLNEATLTLFINNRIAETPQALTPEEIFGPPENYPEDAIFVYDAILYKLFRLNTPLHPGDNIRLEATAENGKYHARCRSHRAATDREPARGHLLGLPARVQRTNPLPPIQNYIARPPQREELLPAGHLE